MSPPPDPPDEKRRDGAQRNWNHPQRKPTATTDQEHRRSEQGLLGTSVGLAPVERRQLAVENMTCHQSDHRLVRVGHA